MNNHNPVTLLIKTYQFLLLRFILTFLMYMPGYFSIKWGIDVGRKFTGIDMFIFDLMFAYCGFIFFLFYINIVKSVVLHFVQYAQVASMTAILQGKKIKGGIVFFGFKSLISRFGSVSAIYFADKFMYKVVKEVSSWVIEKGQFLPEWTRKGFLSRMVGKTLQTTVYHVLEVIVSYLYANPKINLWEGAIKATSLYVQSWKTVLKEAFINSLMLEVFGKVLKFVTFICAVWFLWGKGFLTIVAAYITIQITGHLLRTAFIEPYQTASMLVGYYKGIKDKEPSESVMGRLSDASGEFKRLIFKGKDEGSEFAAQVAQNLTEQFSSSDGEGVFSNIPNWITDSFVKKGEKKDEAG